MKPNNYKYNIFYLILFLFGVIFSGCEKGEVVSDMPDQLFRPRSFEVQVNGVDINFSWVPIANAKYIIEISEDSLLFETNLQQIEIEDAIEYKIESLYSKTQYSARIKAVSKDGSVKDSGYSALAFETGVENIFYAASGDAVGVNYIKVKWVKEKTADKIVICDKDTTVLQNVMLTGENIEAGELIFENLDENTKYIIQIYNGEKLRGTLSVLTYAIISTVTVDMTKNGGWEDLGNYYLLANSGAFTRVRNDGATGYVCADAFRFTKGEYEIIIDNVDDCVSTVGSWSISSSNSTRIGDNYFHDGNSSSDGKSVTYSLELPESGVWSVSIMHPASSIYGNPVPVDIYAGDF